MESREDYARKLQAKYETYMDDFAKGLGYTVEEIILKYVGMDGTKEAMYNTDIILGFLADYYDYYTSRYNQAVLTQSSDIEQLQEKVNEIYQEYNIFEGLIYRISEVVARDNAAGTITTLSDQEIIDGIDEKKEDIDKQKAIKLSSWIKASYYKFIEKYRGKEYTVVMPGKEKIVFTLEDKNLPHLLGIPNNANYSSIQKMNDIISVSKRLPSLTEDRIKTIFDRMKQGFSYAKIKYKNFLFQNYRLSDVSEMPLIYYDVIPRETQYNDSNTYIVTKSRNKTYSKVCLGLYCSHIDLKKMTGYVKSIIAEKNTSRFNGKKARVSMITSIFVGNNSHSNNQLIGVFSREEQYELILQLLDEDPEVGEKLWISLIPYFRNLEANTKRFNEAKMRIEKINSKGRSK